MEGASTALVSIVLRRFSDKLGELGEQIEAKAISTIRILKLAFSAVAGFPEANEPVLAKHVARFIMGFIPYGGEGDTPDALFSPHSCAVQGHWERRGSIRTIVQGGVTVAAGDA